MFMYEYVKKHQIAFLQLSFVRSLRHPSVNDLPFLTVLFYQDGFNRFVLVFKPEHLPVHIAVVLEGKRAPFDLCNTR